MNEAGLPDGMVSACFKLNPDFLPQAGKIWEEVRAETEKYQPFL
jgi:hypothetical protein